jgi:hypothetical protein
MKPSTRSAALAVTAAGCAVAFSLQGTQAAFTATTSSVGTFSAGTVTITDDDSAAALFTATGLKPGDTASKCIAVTYTGSLANQVRLHVGVTETDGGGGAVVNAVLDDHLTVAVDYDASTNGTFADCGDFASDGSIFTGTLGAMATAHSNYGNGRPLGSANGATAWTPATNAVRVFRITYTLASNAPDTVQGDTAVATFTWEAQNT